MSHVLLTLVYKLDCDDQLTFPEYSIDQNLRKEIVNLETYSCNKSEVAVNDTIIHPVASCQKHFALLISTSHTPHKNIKLPLSFNSMIDTVSFTLTCS